MPPCLAKKIRPCISDLVMFVLARPLSTGKNVMFMGSHGCLTGGAMDVWDVLAELRSREEKRERLSSACQCGVTDSHGRAGAPMSSPPRHGNSIGKLRRDTLAQGLHSDRRELRPGAQVSHVQCQCLQGLLAKCLGASAGQKMADKGGRVIAQYPVQFLLRHVAGISFSSVERRLLCNR